MGGAEVGYRRKRGWKTPNFIFRSRKKQKQGDHFLPFLQSPDWPLLIHSKCFQSPAFRFRFFSFIYIPLPFAFFSFLRTHHLRNYFCLVGPSIQRDPKWESIVVQYSKCEGWMMASFLPLSKSNSVRIIPFFIHFWQGFLCRTHRKYGKVRIVKNTQKNR